MLYVDNTSIKSFLSEMCANHHRIVDSVIMLLDGDILLVNVGTKGFRLDSRLKDKTYKTYKSKTVWDICYDYKWGLTPEEEAIQAIKNNINQLINN